MYLRIEGLFLQKQQESNYYISKIEKKNLTLIITLLTWTLNITVPIFSIYKKVSFTLIDNILTHPKTLHIRYKSAFENFFFINLKFSLKFHR